MNKEKYLKKYEKFKTPKSLIDLIKFSLDNDSFSDGFDFDPENEKKMYESYSSENDFLESFIKIGCADYDGSEYAFWLNNGEDLTNAPIVAFGGEGGYHIIAENFDKFIRILTFDCEPMIDWDEVEFYKDEDDFEPSMSAEKFQSWVKENLKVEIIKTDDEIDKIISKAKEIHQTELKKWVSKFYEE